MKVLLTGGLGYIGSHVALKLHDKGIKFCVIDDFSNSNQESLNRLEKICGKFKFINCDLSQNDFQIKKRLADSLKREDITHVIHCMFR